MTAVNRAFLKSYLAILFWLWGTGIHYEWTMENLLIYLIFGLFIFAVFLFSYSSGDRTAFWRIWQMSYSLGNTKWGGMCRRFDWLKLYEAPRTGSKPLNIALLLSELHSQGNVLISFSLPHSDILLWLWLKMVALGLYKLILKWFIHYC